MLRRHFFGRQSSWIGAYRRLHTRCDILDQDLPLESCVKAMRSMPSCGTLTESGTGHVEPSKRALRAAPKKGIYDGLIVYFIRAQQAFQHLATRAPSNATDLPDYGVRGEGDASTLECVLIVDDILQDGRSISGLKWSVRAGPRESLQILPIHLRSKPNSVTGQQADASGAPHYRDAAVGRWPAARPTESDPALDDLSPEIIPLDPPSFLMTFTPRLQVTLPGLTAEGGVLDRLGDLYPHSARVSLQMTPGEFSRYAALLLPSRGQVHMTGKQTVLGFAAYVAPLEGEPCSRPVILGDEMVASTSSLQIRSSSGRKLTYTSAPVKLIEAKGNILKLVESADGRRMTAAEWVFDFVRTHQISLADLNLTVSNLPGQVKGASDAGASVDVPIMSVERGKGLLAILPDLTFPSEANLTLGASGPRDKEAKGLKRCDEELHVLVASGSEDQPTASKGVFVVTQRVDIVQPVQAQGSKIIQLQSTPLLMPESKLTIRGISHDHTPQDLD